MGLWAPDPVWSHCTNYNILLLSGFEPRTVQPVLSSFADCKRDHDRNLPYPFQCLGCHPTIQHRQLWGYQQRRYLTCCRQYECRPQSARLLLSFCNSRATDQRHAVAQLVAALCYQDGRSRVQFPMVSLEFFINNPSGRTVAFGSTQLVTEMGTRNISWGSKRGRCYPLTYFT